jgi:hypothetical protein
MLAEALRRRSQPLHEGGSLACIRRLQPFDDYDPTRFSEMPKVEVHT